MKNKLLSLTIAFFAIWMTNPSWAQTSFEAFKQQKDSKFQTFKDQKQERFDAYRREKNAKYAEFLRQKWGEYDAHPQDTTVKDIPVVPPVIYDNTQPDPTPEPQPIVIEEDVVVIPQPVPQPEPIVPIEPVIDENRQTVTFSFYGTEVSVQFPKPDDFTIPEAAEETLANAWETLMDEKYDIAIKSALEARKKLNLCDWGYIELLQAVAEKHYGKKTREAAFMQAFLLIQSGYKVRLAFTDNMLYPLIASHYTIYDRIYFNIDGEKFYPLNCNEESLYISKASFEAEKPVSLQISSEQLFTDEPSKTRTLTSRMGLTATVSVNRNNIDFYDTYPTACFNDDMGTRWAAYANTPMEKRTRETLYPQLEKALQGKDQLTQVELLLNWVQTAFVYEYDDVVWGDDRAFFPSETLYYPYCDCEDRSILFSRLVQDLIGLDVVLLYYPGHLATAVCFTDDVKGDYLMVNKKKFIVCDPTYIGAPIGETMPDMDNQTAKVIVLK